MMLSKSGQNVSALGAKTAILLTCMTILVVLSTFFDARVASSMPDLPPAVAFLAHHLSELGMSGYMFGSAAAVAIGCVLARLLLRGQRFDAALTLAAERAIYVFAVIAASGIGVQFFKHLVGRARPRLMRSFGPYHFDLLSVKASLASFPSGHATSAFSAAVALGFICPRLRVPLLGLAALVAISRVLLDAHYVSDVVAGGALGVITALGVTRTFADWSFAFERHGPRVQLKGGGLIVGTLAGRFP